MYQFYQSNVSFALGLKHSIRIESHSGKRKVHVNNKILEFYCWNLQTLEIIWYNPCVVFFFFHEEIKLQRQ